MLTVDGPRSTVHTKELQNLFYKIKGIEAGIQKELYQKKVPYKRDFFMLSFLFTKPKYLWLQRGVMQEKR
jgi:hypothetical protein